MQVTGRSCGHCQQRISMALEAEGCEACDVAYHRECLRRYPEGPERCPGCRARFDETAARVQGDAKAARVEHIATGRKLAWETMGGASATGLIAGLLHLFVNEPGGALHLLVPLFPVYVFSRAGGITGDREVRTLENARLFLTLSASLGALIAAALAWGYWERATGLALLDGAAFVIYAGAALVMTTSAAIRDFIDSVDGRPGA